MKHKMSCQRLAGSTKRAFPLSLKKSNGVIDPVVLKTQSGPFCKGVSAISQEVPMKCQNSGILRLFNMLS